MAEGIANNIFPNYVSVQSAGTEAHGLNMYAVEVMQKISMPISHHKSKRIDTNQLDNFDLIITLCGDARDKCPYFFKSTTKHIHWDIEDPANFKGDKIDTINKYIEVRDIIFEKISNFNNNLEKL